MTSRGGTNRQSPTPHTTDILALLKSKGLDPKKITRNYGVAIPDPAGRFVQRFRIKAKRNSKPKKSAFHRLHPGDPSRYVCKTLPLDSGVRVIAVPPLGRKCGMCFPRARAAKDTNHRSMEVPQNVGRRKRQRSLGAPGPKGRGEEDRTRDSPQARRDELAVTLGSVAEYVQADDIHFAAGIPEEGCEPATHPAKWLLTRRTVLGPIGIGDDQEEMLGVSADMGFPKVLDVVIVVDRATPLHFSEDSPARPNWVVEVRSGSCHDPHVSGKEDLFLEPELSLKQFRDDGLDRTTLSPMNVRFLDCRLVLL